MRWVLRVMCLAAVALTPAASAQDEAPWGRAEAREIDYAPNKVVYDVATHERSTFERVLDRASYLNKLYNANPFEASIVLVLHGPEIDYFAIENLDDNRELMRRARSLTVGDVIEIRMCKVAAEGRGYRPEDIHGFVEIVPMADAEIVRLQREEGYAYMR